MSQTACGPLPVITQPTLAKYRRSRQAACLMLHPTGRMETTDQPPGVLCTGPPEMCEPLCVSLPWHRIKYFSFTQTLWPQICCKFSVHMGRDCKKKQTKNIWFIRLAGSLHLLCWEQESLEFALSANLMFSYLDFVFRLAQKIYEMASKNTHCKVL